MDVFLLTQHFFAYAVVDRTHRFAFAHDLGCYALPDFALRTAIRDERLRRPGKHIDEAGRDREPARIDRHLGRSAFEIADAGDAIAAQRNVRLPSFAARSVVDRTAPDNDVELLRRRRNFLRANDRNHHGDEQGGQ